MIKKWEYCEADEEKVRETMRKNDISELVAKILLNRGIEEHEKIQKFLHPKIDDLNAPFLLNDIEIAVNRIIEANEKKEKVTVYGDYDVDGITSIAVLKKFLTELGMNVEYYLPSRLEEGYGLNNEALKKIHDRGTDLIITVDCGISAYDEIEYAKSLEMEVIVTDHHECPEKMPDTIAVIDPKRKDNTYPFNSLAGVGVTFKLIQAISLRLGLDRKRYLKYLDIVCLGTVADIVPLIGENRVIVKFGLMLIKETRNVGLRALIKVSGYTKIDSGLISFGIAPRMNACGRMGKADLALELLLTDDYEKAEKIALELNEINRERQEVEKRIMDEAVKIIEEQKLYENKVIVVGNENWHHGVIGIVASKITEMYYRPSILICFEGEEGKGSGRSIEGFDLHKALSSCSKDLLKFGGHEMAIGLTMKKDEFENFRKDINDYAKENMPEENIPVIKADSYINSENISFEKINELEILEPYGEANPMPMFIYKNIKVDGIRALSNNKHLKLLLKDRSNLYDAIAFNMGDKQYSIKIGDKIDVLHYIDVNVFNNVQRIQFNVKDIKKSL